MLYVSVQDKEIAPKLMFELEDYYRQETRIIHTERSLETFDPAKLAQNEDWMEDLGFVLILGFLSPGYLNDERGSWAQIVYPHERGNKPVLRIDEEVYAHKQNRSFCGSLPLSTTDVDIAIEDEDLKRKIAEAVLEYLPLKAEYCE